MNSVAIPNRANFEQLIREISGRCILFVWIQLLLRLDCIVTLNPDCITMKLAPYYFQSFRTEAKRVFLRSLGGQFPLQIFVGKVDGEVPQDCRNDLWETAYSMSDRP